MIRCILLLAFAAILTGCGKTGQQEGLPPQTDVTEATPQEMPQLTGRQAYEQVCAKCHDEGVDGAPKIGDRDAWVGRSWLWEAVLFEHAKTGYLGMPAKGGEETLEDTTVSRAAEYMLTKTFPEITRD